MKIKTRLSLYFTLISCGALLLVLLALYFLLLGFLKVDFNNRLSDRINVATKLYLDADRLDADSLLEVQQRYLEKLPNEVIRIYDEKNKVAFNLPNGIYWDEATIDQVRKQGSIAYEEGNREVIGKLYRGSQGSFVILASAVDRNFERRIIALAKITAVLFVCFSAILFFVGQWFAKNTLTPIQSIIHQMREIGSGNLHLRIGASRNRDEIAELINNFNSLLQRLENTFELQQSFVSNASHELRTPLTSILGEADLALEKQRSTQEYERVLSSISADAAHLQGTITSLMELAQVDFNYTQAVLQPVRMDELLWELQEHWQHKKGIEKLKLSFAAFPEDETLLEIMGNKPLLLIALNNIVDNAFKYSADAPVSIYFEANALHIEIAISDEGPGIKQEDKSQVFKSFYRVPATKNIQGSGVGLYITSKIVELCKGTIRVDSDGHSGSTFVILFPKLHAVNG